MAEPWRLDAIERGCWCAPMRRPCEFHQGWDLGWEHGVADERERCLDIVDKHLPGPDAWPQHAANKAIRTDVMAGGDDE